MESSRDSSVWRSLAVTFGGGLALGAVGMRLSQTALRPAEVAPRPDSNPLAERLAQMESRLERLETTPPPPASAHVPVIAHIDQKVLEAMVGAVDARIHEHSGEVERRLADLEARIAVEIHSLRHQAAQMPESAEKRLAEIERQVRQEADELREALGQDVRRFGEIVAKAVAGQAATQRDSADLRATVAQDLQTFGSAISQIAAGQEAAQAEMAAERESQKRATDAAKSQVDALRAAVGQDLETLGNGISQIAAGQVTLQAELTAQREFQQCAAGALQAEVDLQLGQFRHSIMQEMAGRVDAHAVALQQSMEARIVTAAVAATAAGFDQRLAPLRAEIDRKEQELTALRQRLADSERGVLDVVLAIGDVCRQAAGRIGSPGNRPSDGAPDAPVAEARATVVPKETAPEASTEEARATAMVDSPALVEEPLNVSAEAAALFLPNGTGTPPSQEPRVDPRLSQNIPDFLTDGNRGTTWRIPLVSSFLVMMTAAGCALMMQLL